MWNQGHERQFVDWRVFTADEVNEKENRPKLVARLIANQGASPAWSCNEWLANAIRPAAASELRIEAVRNMAQHCRDHNVFQTLRFSAEHENDDALVRSAMVRALPSVGQSQFTTSAVVPPPIVVGSGYASKICESMPARRGKSDTAGPAMPPPMMMACCERFMLSR